jgi:hypothetical protein
MKSQAQFLLPGSLNRAIVEVDVTLASGNSDIVLDFVDCGFVTVDGVEWLEELLLRADSAGAKVELKNVTPSIYKVFKVAKMDSILRSCGGSAPSGPVC